MASKETYQSTSLTRGIVSPRDSRAVMRIHVTGLDGSRSSLDDAITSAISGRTVHPDDLTLPLRTATAQWLRGADNGNNAEALVILQYDKRGSSSTGSDAEFSNIATVSVRYQTIGWWAKRFPEPADEAGDAEVLMASDPMGNPSALVPKLTTIEVPIWDIEIPTVLASSPIESVDHVVGTINSSSKTLSNKSFAAKTLRFNGVRQSATKIQDGASVTYEFGVNYSFSYRQDGWYYSYLTTDGAGPDASFRAKKELMYTPASWPVFPYA